MTRGFWLGAAAYSIWGLFPIYWKLVAAVPAGQVLAHRIVWSCVALGVILALRRRTSAPDHRVPGHRLTSRIVLLYLAAAILIGVNWFLYVWAVGHDFVVETSLGYYITPLVNVLLGVAILRERLQTATWAAVGLAACGVAVLTWAYGAPPRIALGLAASFGTYGLVKKTAPLPPLEGLALETALLALPALAYLVAAERAGSGAFLHETVATDLFLIGGGLVTIVPLLLFASAVRTVALSTMGLLQFISPTIQLVLALALYHEPFGGVRLAGFAAVWVALAVFALHELRSRRPSQVAADGSLTRSAAGSR
ncbi:MAG TPA: EamA family transporter RarD [Vicinamibacterales bacterium]|nr:EamA family transporter RarD [Vicinamibacterales bacterium]